MYSDATLIHHTFNEEKTLHHLKHYLPSQAPLKDFVHHNLLHAFESMHFFDANYHATKIFGYKTYLNIHEYRALYKKNVIEENIIEKIITQRKGKNATDEWKFRMLYDNIEIDFSGKIGRVMHLWKDYYHVNISKYIQPVLFRIVSNYLDQGITLFKFPYDKEKSFLENIIEIEKQSVSSYFNNKNGRARDWLISQENLEIKKLLDILVADEEWYEDYLFDMCFEHPGWSGIVSVIEDRPDTLIHKRNITLKEFIILELLLQIDYLDSKFGENWLPLCKKAQMPNKHLFDIPEKDIRFETLELWQEALEWSYYEKVLNGISEAYKNTQVDSEKSISFQSIHCIDDREESFRRYIENIDTNAKTFGTAGFFNMDILFKPQHSDHYIKLAPANAHPRHIIEEHHSNKTLNEDINLNPHSHSLFRGWIISQTIGFWSALKLGMHIFKPHHNPAVITAIEHSEPHIPLEYDFKKITDNQLKIGLTDEDAVNKLETLLKSIGLITNFAPLVYIIGHGAGSTNNPYYAAYDCGACSGKPGSVNARVAAYFLNKKSVRKLLSEKGIHIPESTQFVAALHNTTSDKIYFFDTEGLSETNKKLHEKNIKVFNQALLRNAKERARRFETVEKKNKSLEYIYSKVQEREYALFIPRPEYNHATNALCYVGRRSFIKNLFLDRRAFLNSYDYTKDKDGKYLFNILQALTNVCGGINLEYYYSRVDSEKLGAGSKLPHNVFGLIGVSNGSDGDLRYGLPQQMTEIHQPLRLLIIIEHLPDIVWQVIQSSASLKNWFDKGWIHLVVWNPEKQMHFKYSEKGFEEYVPERISINTVSTTHLLNLFETASEDLPVYFIKN